MDKVKKLKFPGVIRVNGIMISISKIILISYFLVSRFQDAIQHEKREDIECEFQLIKKELEIELLKKQDGFQMVDSNYKQKVWDKLFYKRSVDQNIITIAIAVEIFLGILVAIHLIISLIQVVYRFRIFLILSQV